MPAFTRWSAEWLVLLGQFGDTEPVVAAAREVVEFHCRDDLAADIVATTAEVPEPPSDSALVGLPRPDHHPPASTCTHDVQVEVAAIDADDGDLDIDWEFDGVLAHHGADEVGGVEFRVPWPTAPAMDASAAGGLAGFAGSPAAVAAL